jgi:hypothetical protein
MVGALLRSYFKKQDQKPVDVKSCGFPPALRMYLQRTTAKTEADPSLCSG